MKDNEGNIVISLVAITSLAIIAICCLITSFDHFLLTTITACIAGIAGFRIGHITR